jgi:hypothetical protein
MHNVQLADPDNKFVKQIRQVTDKRKKSEDDRVEIAKLEWFGGLYAGEQGPVMPTANVRKCLAQAAVVTKQKTAVLRSVSAYALTVPLDYKGPRELDKLFALPEHHHRAAIGIGAKKTMRTRPQFPDWSLTLEVELVTEALDFDDFVRITKSAGRTEGLGDNRVNGYGRFDSEVKTLA